MVKKGIVALILTVAGAATFAQPELPNYKTSIDKFKRYYNSNQPDSIFNMFSPEVKTGLPLDKTKDLVSQMHAQLGDLKQTTFTKYYQTAGIYKADYNTESLLINLSLNQSNQIDGLYFNEYKPEKATEKPAVITTAKPATVAVTSSINDPSLTESPITLSTLGGIISGSLVVPNSITEKIPVVLIIPDSRLSDRDGNTADAQPNTYKLLAEALGKAGIATVRYDNRGVGLSKSTGKEEDKRFTDHVDDASALMDMLKDDKRFSKVIVLGHGTGALVGMLSVASSETPLNGFISAEGAGESGEFVLAEAMKSKPPSVGAECKRIIDSLRKGKTTEKVDPALYNIMRPGLQKYMMSWMAFDPAKVIKRVKIPILVIQGTTDMQTSATQGDKLKKAKSEATLKTIDGMSHILKDGPADKEKNLATYNDPTLPIKPELVTAIVAFAKSVK